MATVNTNGYGCVVCGMRPRDYSLDGHGTNRGSFTSIVREFWAEHTMQACKLAESMARAMEGDT